MAAPAAAPAAAAVPAEELFFDLDDPRAREIFAYAKWAAYAVMADDPANNSVAAYISTYYRVCHDLHLLLPMFELEVAALTDPKLIAWIEAPDLSASVRHERLLSYAHELVSLPNADRAHMPRSVLERAASALGIADPNVPTVLSREATASRRDVFSFAAQMGLRDWIAHELEERRAAAARAIYERADMAAGVERMLRRPGMPNDGEAADLQNLVGSFASSHITPDERPVLTRAQTRQRLLALAAQAQQAATLAAANAELAALRGSLKRYAIEIGDSDDEKDEEDKNKKPRKDE